MRRDPVDWRGWAKRKEIARRLISLETMRMARRGDTPDYTRQLSGGLPPVNRASAVVSGAWVVMTVAPFRAAAAP